MQRYSYEWVDPDSGEDHFSDELYAIYDAKRGLEFPIAWAWDRDGAELIVDALNQVHEMIGRAATMVALAVHRDKYDLSDLLG